MRNGLAFGIALVVLAAPAVAQDAVPQASDSAATAQQAPKAKPKGEPKICRAMGATGSRLGNRVCRTQAEWDRLAAGGADQGLDSVQTMGGMR